MRPVLAKKNAFDYVLKSLHGFFAFSVVVVVWVEVGMGDVSEN